ncbi:MAG: hypothetical protein V3V14_08355 [Saprospiraceae bacterium]
MPTVDDLVISLTIKETGNLGKLKKSLDSLVGTKAGGIKGVVPSFMYLKRDLIGLKQDSTYIKKRLTFLMPNVIPRSKEQMKETARIARTLIDKTRETLIDKMISKDKNALLGMMQAQGITTEAELREFLGDKLTEYQYRLEEIMRGRWSGEKAQRFLVRMDRLIAAQDFAGGYSKKLLEDIENSIAEFNREMAILLEARGISAIPEFQIYQPYLEKLSEAMMTAVRRGDPLVDFKEFFGYLGLESEEAKDTLNNINSLLYTNKNTMDFLNASAKKLGITLTKDMFTEAEVAKSDVLKTIAAGMSWLWFKGKGKPEAGGFPEGFRQQLTLIMDTLFSGNFSKIKGLWKQRRVDMAILGGDLDELTDIFGVRLGTVIHKQAVHFLELKTILSKTNVNQFKEYLDLYGKKNVSAVASLIRPSFKDILPGVITKSMNMMAELQKAGKIDKMTPAEMDEIKDTFEKKFTSEAMITGVKQVMENLKTIIPANIYKALRETDEWKGVIEDLTNEELKDETAKALNDAIKELQKDTLLNPQILRVLKMIAVTLSMGGKDVTEMGTT